VESGGEPGRAAASLAYRSAAETRTVGITGAPGAGKSTLTGCLLGTIGASGIAPLAVLAVDPTSPYSGGAMLGDRVRMQDQAAAAGAYVRSMATRGHLGGLSLAVPEVVRVLGAAGMGLVVVETVGVGQVEVEVASATDTTVVVVNPRWGDAIQANKAGLMEVADVFVVNKADLPGAAETRRDLEQMLDLAGHHGGRPGTRGAGEGAGASDATGSWRPPVVETVAASGQGVDELWQAIVAHQRYLEGGGRLQERRRARLERELQRVLDARIAAEVARLGRGAGAEVLAAVLDHRLDPYEAADQIVGAAVARVGRRAVGSGGEAGSSR
jgi:LAO/AO transport system kinase